MHGEIIGGSSIFIQVHAKNLRGFEPFIMKLVGSKWVRIPCVIEHIVYDDTMKSPMICKSLTLPGNLDGLSIVIRVFLFNEETKEITSRDVPASTFFL